MTAREIALNALIRCRTEGAWSESAIQTAIKNGNCNGLDAALATRIFYSVVQNRTLLDFYIENNLKCRLKDLQPVVLDILRIAVAQIVFFDKIPDSAAVDEAVSLTKKRANDRAAGLVNAVLRNIIRSKDSLPDTKDYSIKYSCPQELIRILKENVGSKNLEPLLIAQNTPVPITIRVNSLKTDKKALQERLLSEHVSVKEHPFCSDCLVISETGNISTLESFKEGLFFVQDAACVLASAALSPEPGMRVLDCCSAPGGKSFSAAMLMKNQGEMISCDIHEHKIPLIQAGAKRLGITIIQAMEKDATQDLDEWHESFDRIICDVPCSGLGVIRKKPDIRWKNLDSITNLPAIQLQILENQSRFLKHGGILVYSTCTIVHEENESVIDEFLSKHPDFSLDKLDLPFEENNRGDITLYPHIHQTDGFYICRLRRT